MQAKFSLEMLFTDAHRCQAVLRYCVVDTHTHHQTMPINQSTATTVVVNGSGAQQSLGVQKAV